MALNSIRPVSIRSVLALVSVATLVSPAFAAVPVSGSGSMTVNSTPVAPPPVPLAAPGAAPLRTSSADPLAGALSNGVASPLTTGPDAVCCPCRTIHHVVHRRVVRRAARPTFVEAEVAPPRLVPLYPVVAYRPVYQYRPVYVARPVVVYRPRVLVYGRPYPVLGAPFFYGPRRIWRSYYRPGW